jgi:NAD(P)-dependent dehydrogenase (short-subunit alcohol dehydrogenase family)
MNAEGGALHGQVVVVIGGSQGIGFETARLARAVGADVIITGRNPERLKASADELGAIKHVAFDATDWSALGAFLQELPTPIDHVLVTAGGSYYALLRDIDMAEVQRTVSEHLLLPLNIALAAPGKVRDGGSLTFMSGTGARHPAPGLTIAGTLSVGLPTLIENLALELAPIRVNLLAPGFVDTPLSAAILGDDLDARRDELRKTLPIRRVIGPEDVAALAVHLMTNSALTGATFDIDGGQQLLS